MSSLSSAEPGCCAPCLFGGEYVVVTPPFELGGTVTRTRTLIPQVTIDSLGSSHTTGTKTITPQVIDDGAEATYVVNGATLTVPTTYAYYMDFQGAVPPAPTVTGWNASTCASTDGLFFLDVPAVTTEASPFMVPLANTSASAVADTLPSEVLAYLDQLDTVQTQMDNSDLFTCSSTTWSSSCPTPRPSSCPTFTETTFVEITVTATAANSATADLISSGTGYSISISPHAPSSTSSISSNPCITTLTAIITVTSEGPTTPALPKPTKSAVTYEDEFGDAEVEPYTTPANAPASAVTPQGNGDAPTTPAPTTPAGTDVQPAQNTGEGASANDEPSAAQQNEPTPSPPNDETDEQSAETDRQLSANNQASATSQSEPTLGQAIDDSGTQSAETNQPPPQNVQPSAADQSDSTPDLPQDEPDVFSNASDFVPTPTQYTLSDGTEVTYTPSPIVVTSSGTVRTYYPVPSVSTVSGSPVLVAPTPEVSIINGQTIIQYPPALSSTMGMGDYIMSGLEPTHGGGAPGSNGTDSSYLPPQQTGAAEKRALGEWGGLLGAVIGLVAVF